MGRGETGATGLDAMAPAAGPWLGLAPMEGVTDPATRLWFSQTSAPAVQWTPFLRVTPTYPPGRVPMAFAPEHGPWRGGVNYALITQCMASDATSMLRAAELFLPLVSYVDLNCGCPAPNALKGGAGVSLLREADQFRARLEVLLAGMGARRLSVKMRTGYTASSEFPRLLEALAGLPLRHVTVHGRTRVERYRGVADWSLIRQASETLDCPVIGSGDVVDAVSWRARQAAAPRIHGAIVGRGALRQPWLFSDLARGDGGAAPLPYAALRAALAVFLLWQEAQKRADGEALTPLVAEGLLRGRAGREAEAWEALRHRTVALVFAGKDPFPAGEWHRASLGRLKMLWSSLRSSLPPLFFAPTLLRAASPEAFFAGLDALADAHAHAAGADARDALPVAHRPECDRFYAGGGGESDEGPSPGPEA